MAIMISVPSSIMASQASVERLTKNYNDTITGMESEINKTMTLIECSLTPTYVGGFGQDVGGGFRFENMSREVQYINESAISDITAVEGVKDVLAFLEKADQTTITKFENAIKSRSEEGAWLFYNKPCEVKPVALDPRARFEYYVEHIVNQFYLGCETPLPRLFSTPGFTEASAKAALDLQTMMVKPIQRYIKRQVERDIFDIILAQAGFDPVDAQVRLNWGSEEVPEIVLVDMLKAAELGLIRQEEFRKNVMKFGWQLWEKPQPETSMESARK